MRVYAPGAFSYQGKNYPAGWQDMIDSSLVETLVDMLFVFPDARPGVPGEMADPMTGVIGLVHGGIRKVLPYILAQSANPVILAPSGTWNDTTGGMTLGTALPYTPSGTVLVYLTNSGIATSGLYYATFSSTTACQVYSDVAATVKPATTAGAYTAPTSAVVLATVTIPGGAMGPNGSLRATAGWACPSNANNKTLRTQIAGGGLAPGTTVVTSSSGSSTGVILANRGAQSRQVARAVGTGALVPSYPSVDTSVSQPLTFTGQLAVATDYIILDGYTVEILPG